MKRELKIPSSETPYSVINDISTLAPIFIIGHPKSGTSLVTSLLDSHKELLVISEESDFYSSTWRQAKLLNYQWKLSQEQKLSALINYIVEATHFKNYFRGDVENDISGNLNYSEFPTQKFKEELLSLTRLSMYGKRFKQRELFEAILNAYLLSNNKLNHKELKYFVEKTPKHTWFLNEIKSDFPNAKFIFVCRDPRDNYVSYKRKWGDKMNAIRFSKSWNDAIRIFEEAQNKMDIHFLKYEDLLNDPKGVVMQLVSFLGINWNDTLLQPTRSGILWKGNSMFKSETTSIHTESIGRFRNNISGEDLSIIEFLCVKEMKRYNYILESLLMPSEIEQRKLINEYNELLPVYIGKGFSLRRYLGLMKIILKGIQ